MGATILATILILAEVADGQKVCKRGCKKTGCCDRRRPSGRNGCSVGEGCRRFKVKGKKCGRIGRCGACKADDDCAGKDKCCSDNVVGNFVFGSETACQACCGDDDCPEANKCCMVAGAWKCQMECFNVIF